MSKKEQSTHIYTDKELAGIKRISLEMASVFWDFCKEYELTAYLCGGGCIGALRTGGFIPWDDDLDFFMPRRDYERFLSHWNEYKPGKNYVLSNSGKNYTDRNLFATLRDKRTTCIKPYQDDLDIVHGVSLDILPLDGYPDDKGQRRNQVIWAYIYSLFRAGTIPEKHGGLMKFGSRILLGIFRGQKIRYRIWRKAEKHMTKYKIRKCDGITELCSGPGYMKNWYDKIWFNTYREVPFEDRMLPIPIGAEDYLVQAFGDYTVLPPEEERVAHHDCVFLDLEKSYKEYRGKYYLRNKEPKKKGKDWKVK